MIVAQIEFLEHGQIEANHSHDECLLRVGCCAHSVMDPFFADNSRFVPR